MNFVIFDDEKWNNFFPITLTRSTGDLRVGILKLRQRISSYLDVSETNIIVSSYLESIYKERHKDWKVNEIKAEETIFINSRVKIDASSKKAIMSLLVDECLVSDDTILAVKCTPKKQNITSPTYTYYNKYNDIYHFDLYRLKDYNEFFAIGAEDILDNNDGVILVEWPELIEKYYKPDIEIILKKTDNEDEREIEVNYSKL